MRVLCYDSCMSSPEAHPQEQPLSAEQQDIWRVLVKKKALRLLEALEAFYLSEEEQEKRKSFPLTNERYQEWLSWMKKIDADPKALFRQHMLVDEGAIAEKSKAFMDAMEALEELRVTQRLSEATKKNLGIEIREDEYLVSVDYGPLSSKNLLEQEFAGVADSFDGRPFEKHPSCRGMDESNGIRFMKLFRFDEEIESEGAIARADKEGYRPATEKEVCAFSKAYPELVDYVGLGAFVVYDGSRGVANVWQSGAQRFLGLWFGSGWNHRARALFVRKAS